MTGAVDPAVVARNLEAIRRRLVELGGSHVEIVAVTKGFEIDAVRAAMAAGCTSIGENYAQEVVAKFSTVPPDERPTIHFIGSLQSNKVSMLAPYVDVWQTLDRPSIIESVAKKAPGAQVLVQVNATGEDGKGGCAVTEVPTLVARARDLGLDVRGLMTVGPTDGDRELTHRAFAIVADACRSSGLHDLSMGMSDDLDIAVPLGATMVRIGRALFGERPPKSAL